MTLTLFSAALLAGCGGDKEENTSTWSGGSGSSAAPAATTAPADPAADPAADPTTAAGDKPAASDASLCKAIDKAGKDMIKQISTNPTDAGMNKAAETFAKTLTKKAGTAGDTEVGTNLKKMSTIINEAVDGGDPFGALENSKEYDKTGEKLEAACKAAGVNISGTGA